MSKLDYDLLQDAESHINPLKERELDLRGQKIQRIENLILTKDSNDAIDFTDNDIRLLGNFPKMPSLKTLLMSNNRISKIEKDLHLYLPGLSSLILNNNALTELGDLDPIGYLKLEIFSCIDNVVANKQYYRFYIIHRYPQFNTRCPSIRILDGRRVRESERNKAAQLFSGPQGMELLEELGKKSVVNEEEIVKKKRPTPYQQPSEDEKKRIKLAIKNAKTLNEIAQLEQQLAGGVVEF